MKNLCGSFGEMNKEMSNYTLNHRAFDGEADLSVLDDLIQLLMPKYMLIYEIAFGDRCINGITYRGSEFTIDFTETSFGLNSKRIAVSGDCPKFAIAANLGFYQIAQ